MSGTDLISRQAAIDDLQGKDPSQIWDTADIEVWLNALPPAQPEASLMTVNVSIEPEEIERVVRKIKDAPVMVLPSAQQKRTEECTETHACDCISRQAAIDELRKCQTYLFDERDPDKKISLESAEMAISDLPSAQPDLDEWCTDCKEYDQEHHRCPRWNRVIRNTLKEQAERKKG